MHSCSRCLAIAAIAHLLQLSHCKRLALVQRAQAPTRRLRRRRADIETRRGDRRRCGSKGAGSLREFGSILGGAAITRADNKLDASSLREQTPRGVASLLGWGRRMRNMRSHGTAYSVCSRDRGSITGGQQTLLGGAADTTWGAAITGAETASHAMASHVPHLSSRTRAFWIEWSERDEESCDEQPCDGWERINRRNACENVRPMVTWHGV